MSGAWESAMVDEAVRYGDPATRIPNMWEAYKKARATGRRPLTSYTKAQEEAFEAGARAVIAAQLGWDTNPAPECVWELRRGEASIFYPLFKDNPSIWVNCPSGRVHLPGMRVITDQRGECSDCGYDLVSGVLSAEREGQ